MSLYQFKQLLKESFPYFLLGSTDFFIVINTVNTFYEMCMRNLLMNNVEVFGTFALSIGKGYLFSCVAKWGWLAFKRLRKYVSTKDLIIPFYTIFRGIKKLFSNNHRRKRYG